MEVILGIGLEACFFFFLKTLFEFESMGFAVVDLSSLAVSSFLSVEIESVPLKIGDFFFPKMSYKVYIWKNTFLLKCTNV